MPISASQTIGKRRRRLAAVLTVLAGALLFTAAKAKDLHIAVLGDSLSAGFQIPAKAAFPAQLEQRLRKRGFSVVLINAAVSGDTTNAGLARLDWAVADNVDGVILELGANDALRGIDPARTYANLEAIVERLQTRGIAVFLAGMRAPRNLGERYAESFDGLFPRLAKSRGLPMYSFFLEGVIFRRDLLLPDGMHPNEKGVAVIADSILPHIINWLPSLSSNAPVVE